MNRFKVLSFVLFSLFFTQVPYDLSTCETSIESNVPSFYKKYFHCVDIKLSESGNYVNLYYNGLAPYDSWYYSSENPNHIPWASQGEEYFLIENAYIAEMDYVISIPVNPVPREDLVIDEFHVDGEVTVNGVTYEYPMGSVGSALNGVNLFNPCASPPDAIEDEAYSFDLYSGHPAGSSGIYHYHTTSAGPLEVLESKMPDVVTSTVPGSAEIEVYGVMCDGAVVLGCTELDGSEPDRSDWDAQNGHVHDMIDESGVTMLENRYHTHICYSELTEEDTDNNGFQEHEFTPEISYYKTPGMGESFDRCAAMSEPIEPDMEADLSVDDELVPSGIYISNAYPNPFNPQTKITLTLENTHKVLLEVYSLNGILVDVLENRIFTPGTYSVAWNAADLTSGLYIVKTTVGELVQSQKVILAK